MMHTSINIVLIVLLLQVNAFSSLANDHLEERVYEYAGENNKCFKCHGHKTYFYYNDWIEREVKERMNPYFVVDSILFYRSNHWNFKCTDCHSAEYEDFPHSGELRMEEKYTCLDCHGDDENYEDFHFERIDEEFQSSVHSTKHSEDFTCWMCHNPHEYHISARNTINIKETIIYDNDICLSCHADINKYQLLTDMVNPNIIEKHEWLPNQALHFLNVRCIECHAEIKEDILVAHNVQTKDKAVKLCVECHSGNSLLLASLYKYQSQENRSKYGFFNAVILNNSYIIGANRNYILNIVSLVIFGLVILGIIVHIAFRANTK